jgi:hypothetical protein
MPKNRKAREDKQVYGVLDYVKKHNITGPLFCLTVPSIRQPFRGYEIPVLQSPTQAKAKTVKK